MIKLSKNNNLETFSGLQVENEIQIKKMYLRLFVEVERSLVVLKDDQKKVLTAITKKIRRMINFFGKNIKDAIRQSPGLNLNPILNNNSIIAADSSIASSSISINSFSNTQWFKIAHSFAYPERRYWGDTQSTKKHRVHIENQDGILTMPLLEPYLKVKWPKKRLNLQLITNQKSLSSSDAVLTEYSRKLIERENMILDNKRFGI